MSSGRTAGEGYSLMVLLPLLACIKGFIFISLVTQYWPCFYKVRNSPHRISHCFPSQRLHHCSSPEQIETLDHGVILKVGSHILRDSQSSKSCFGMGTVIGTEIVCPGGKIYVLGKREYRSAVNHLCTLFLNSWGKIRLFLKILMVISPYWQLEQLFKPEEGNSYGLNK